MPGGAQGTREIAEPREIVEPQIKYLFSRRGEGGNRGEIRGKSHVIIFITVILTIILTIITILHGAAGMEHSMSGARMEGLAAQVTFET